MAAPIPPNIWSWKHSACVKCGTTSKQGRNKHYLRGLCIACYDWWRAHKDPKYQERIKKSRKKTQERLQNDPQFRERKNFYQRNWRINSKSYKVFEERQKRKLQYDRFVQNWFENRDKKWQKRHQGIILTIEFNEVEYRIKTPLHDILNGHSLEEFKSRVIKYLKNKKQLLT